METTMKAAVVREFGQPLVIKEVAVPRLGSGEIMVQIEASGVCHTLQEALDFAAAGKVTATVSTDRPENVTEIFDRMLQGRIDGRVVLDMAA